MTCEAFRRCTCGLSNHVSAERRSGSLLTVPMARAADTQPLFGIIPLGVDRNRGRWLLSLSLSGSKWLTTPSLAKPEAGGSRDSLLLAWKKHHQFYGCKEMKSFDTCVWLSQPWRHRDFRLLGLRADGLPIVTKLLSRGKRGMISVCCFRLLSAGQFVTQQQKMKMSRLVLDSISESMSYDQPKCGHISSYQQLPD